MWFSDLYAEVERFLSSPFLAQHHSRWLHSFKSLHFLSGICSYSFWIASERARFSFSHFKLWNCSGIAFRDGFFPLSIPYPVLILIFFCKFYLLYYFKSVLVSFSGAAFWDRNASSCFFGLHVSSLQMTVVHVWLIPQCSFLAQIFLWKVSIFHSSFISTA